MPSDNDISTAQNDADPVEFSKKISTSEPLANYSRNSQKKDQAGEGAGRMEPPLLCPGITSRSPTGLDVSPDRGGGLGKQESRLLFNDDVSVLEISPVIRTPEKKARGKKSPTSKSAEDELQTQRRLSIRRNELYKYPFWSGDFYFLQSGSSQRATLWERIKKITRWFGSANNESEIEPQPVKPFDRTYTGAGPWRDALSHRQVRLVFGKNAFLHSKGQKAAKYVVAWKREINFFEAFFTADVWKCMIYDLLYSILILCTGFVAPAVLILIVKQCEFSRSAFLSGNIFCTFGTIMLFYIFGSQAVDCRISTSYYRLMKDRFATNFLIFLLFFFYIVRLFVREMYFDGQGLLGQGNVFFWLLCLFQVTSGIVFSHIEIRTFGNKTIFHLFCHHHHIKLPTKFELIKQIFFHGIFFGLYSMVVIIVSAICVKTARNIVVESFPYAIVIWVSVLGVKVIYELSMTRYFTHREMLYYSITVSETMYFVVNMLLSVSLRISFLLRLKQGCLVGGLMLLIVEGAFFINTIRQSLLKLRDQELSNRYCTEVMNKKVILKITNMQACSCINIISPVMAMAFLFFCKYSTKTHHQYVDDIWWVQKSQGDMVALLIFIQIGPSLFIDLIKYCVLRRLGFDLMAFWKTQRDFRLTIGKTLASMFASCIVMLLLIDDDQFKPYMIYDTDYLSNG